MFEGCTSDLTGLSGMEMAL